MKKTRRINFRVLADLSSLIIIAVFSAIVLISYGKMGVSYDNMILSLDREWKDAAGNVLDLEDLPGGDIELSHSLAGIDTLEKRLCFKSSNTHFTVAFDGVTGYQYAPELPKILGQSYGMDSKDKL